MHDNRNKSCPLIPHDDKVLDKRESSTHNNMVRRGSIYCWLTNLHWFGFGGPEPPNSSKEEKEEKKKRPERLLVHRAGREVN
jgi:hypothetical protein